MGPGKESATQDQPESYCPRLLLWPHLTARSLWPSNSAALGDGEGRAAEPLLRKRAPSQARGTSAGKGSACLLTVAVMLIQDCLLANKACYRHKVWR